ncbi:MAG: hypothetical protein HUJ42_03715 [Malacoplasma sp.]|nr:hypothetical protein [Malacoplasma sp.]
MKKYQGFKIAFISKAVINKNSSGCKIKGDAYYLISDDYQKIIKQFIQLNQVEFRPTDLEMQKTCYYNQTNPYIKIRKEILESIQESNNVDKNKISKKQKLKVQINENDLIIINQKLLGLSAVKRSIDIFTGSNSSGAETNNLSCDILTQNPINLVHNKTFTYMQNCNFSNPFNHKLVYQKDKSIGISKLDEIELIEIETFFTRNKVAEDLFIKYNLNQYHCSASNKYIANSINDWIQINPARKKIVYRFKPNGNYQEEIAKIKFQIGYFLATNNQNEASWNKEIKKFEFKLRNYQKSLFANYELPTIYALHKNELNNSQNYYQFCENDDSNFYEFVHIISSKEAKQEISVESLFQIADNNNCLLISPNLHTSFDNNQVYFDDKGYCYNSSNNQKIVKIYIKKEFLTNQRKAYLKKSFVSKTHKN